MLQNITIRGCLLAYYCIFSWRSIHISQTTSLLNIWMTNSSNASIIAVMQWPANSTLARKDVRTYIILLKMIDCDDHEQENYSTYSMSCDGMPPVSIWQNWSSFPVLVATNQFVHPFAMATVETHDILWQCIYHPAMEFIIPADSVTPFTWTP